VTAGGKHRPTSACHGKKVDPGILGKKLWGPERHDPPTRLGSIRHHPDAFSRFVVVKKESIPTQFLITHHFKLDQIVEAVIDTFGFDLPAKTKGRSRFHHLNLERCCREFAVPFSQ